MHSTGVAEGWSAASRQVLPWVEGPSATCSPSTPARCPPIAASFEPLCEVASSYGKPRRQHFRKLFHPHRVAVIAQCSTLACLCDRAQFLFVLKVMPDHLQALIGRIVGRDFTARLEHFMEIVLAVRQQQRSDACCFEETHVVRKVRRN